MPRLKWRWVRMLDPWHEHQWRAYNAANHSNITVDGTIVGRFQAGELFEQYVVRVLTPGSFELWLCSNSRTMPGRSEAI